MKQNKRKLILWLVLIVVLAAACVLTGGSGGETETVQGSHAGTRCSMRAAR